MKPVGGLSKRTFTLSQVQSNSQSQKTMAEEQPKIENQSFLFYPSDEQARALQKSESGLKSEQIRFLHRASSSKIGFGEAYQENACLRLESSLCLDKYALDEIKSLKCKVASLTDQLDQERASFQQQLADNAHQSSMKQLSASTCA